MKTPRIKKIKFTWTETLLLLALVLEFAFVVYANLARIPVTMDNDNAKLFTHAIEIWNTKEIFIPTWVNETMLELDTSLLLAVPVYGITGNIYLSFGIANILLLLVYYAFFVSLLKRMDQPVSVKILACLLLTIPYSFGQLMYFNMMFFSGGFYGIKILLPIMLIWLLTTSEKSRRALFYVVACLATVFSFVFSVSTGPYSLLCSIFPVVICYLYLSAGKMQKVRELFARWFVSVPNLILYAQGIAALAGIYIGNRMQVDSSGSNMRLLRVQDFSANAQFLLSGFFEQLGALPDRTLETMSRGGISVFAHFLLACLVLIGVIAVTVRYFKRLKATSEIAPSREYVCYPVFLFVWNILILLICDVKGQSRYLLIALVPMIPLLVLFYRELVSRVRGIVQRALLHAAFCGLIGLVALLSDVTVLRDDCTPPMAPENAKYKEVLAMLDTYPQHQVFLLNDTGMAEYLRVSDYGSGREYLSYMTEQGGVFVHDYYESRTDASFFEQDHILLVDEYMGKITDLPEYLGNCYTEAGSYQNIRIYKGSVNRMDGAAGYAANARSIDYAYTPGYQILNGTLQEDGSLLVEGDGEICLSSPWLSAAAQQLTCRLQYEVLQGTGEAGKLLIADANTHEVITEAPLQAGQTEAVIPDLVLSGRDIAVQVLTGADTKVKIYRIVYER